MNPSDFVRLPFRSGVAGVAWPPLARGNAAVLAGLVQQLDGIQWLEPATIRSRQFRQLRLLAEHCAAHSPQFARRLQAAALTPAELASFHGLARLPVLRRREVQDGGDLFCAEVPAEHQPVHESRTSGSTGEPVVVRRTELTNMMWLGLMLRDQIWHRRDFKGRLCTIRANVAESSHHRNWGGIAGELFETGEVLVIPISTPVSELVDRIDAFRPDALLAYPNVIAGMVEECRVRGRGFDGLNHLRSIGETLPQHLREEAGACFGAKVTDSYSSQETGYLTIECPDSGLHHIMAEGVILEVLRDDGTPCDEGEMGRVVVTDLHNFATPLIRYDIGDFAEPGPPCPCGRGLPTLRRVVGRERNLLRLADGRRHWPLLGGLHFRDVAPVRQFQAIQHSYERIEIRLVCERPLSPIEEADLRAMIGRALGHDFTLDLRTFEGRLPTGANGKFEEFICRIEAA